METDELALVGTPRVIELEEGRDLAEVSGFFHCLNYFR